MIWTDLARRVANDTAPRADAVSRVRTALQAHVQPTTALLGAAFPASTVDATQRVREGLVRRRAAPSRGRVVFFGFGAVAGLATMLLFVSVPVVPVQSTVTLAAGAITLSDTVSVVAAGSGAATGSASAWRIAWDNGRVDVGVTPEVGAVVAVETREARVEVVGTEFSVDRNALGTAVDVQHGIVRVTCFADGSVHELVAGDALTCIPTSASGLLGRASSLSDAQGAVDDVLATLDAAALLPADAPVHSEILFQRAAALVQAGRLAEAAVALHEVIVQPAGARSDDARTLAVQVALVSGNCVQAKTILAEMGSEHDDLSARVNACIGGAQ